MFILLHVLLLLLLKYSFSLLLLSSATQPLTRNWQFRWRRYRRPVCKRKRRLKNESINAFNSSIINNNHNHQQQVFILTHWAWANLALLITLTTLFPSFLLAPLISRRVCDAWARMFPPTALYALGTNMFPGSAQIWFEYTTATPQFWANFFHWSKCWPNFCWRPLNSPLD
jgi:hypothetical protein